MLRIAATAEYLNIFTTINQQLTSIIHKGHEVASMKPIQLATPLPPLNFNHIGKICPRIAKKPQITPTSVPKYLCIIKQGKKVFAIEASHVKTFGTIKEICSSFDLSINEIKGENASSGHQRRTLVVDIDKTICESPIGKDYSKCQSIEPVCEKLREENNKGTYIILYTSRNVRTFKGNIGLINKYTNVVLAEWLKNNNIPYDEIYFNKPWGFGDLNYIDDKFLSIEEFKSD